MINLSEARETLSHDSASYTALYEAAVVISSSSTSTIDDLLCCLRRGSIAAEIAAMELHKRTKRTIEDKWPAPIVTDAGDWMEYLKLNKSR